MVGEPRCELGFSSNQLNYNKTKEINVTTRCELCSVKVKKGFKLCYRCQTAVNHFCVTEKDITFQEGVTYFSNIEPLKRIRRLQWWYERQLVRWNTLGFTN